MQHGGVDPGLHHAGHVALVLRCESFRESSRCVIAVPVERFRQHQALSRPQTECMHVIDENQQASDVLSALDDAEFGRLLDGVDGIAAGVREPDDLGLGCLRLQQKRREIAGVQRVTNLSHDLAAVGFDHRRGVTLERVPEGVICRDEEPSIAADLDCRLAGAIGKRPGVVGPVHGIGRTFRPREVGARRPRDQESLIPLAHEFVDRERNR